MIGERVHPQLLFMRILLTTTEMRAKTNTTKTTTEIEVLWIDTTVIEIDTETEIGITETKITVITVAAIAPGGRSGHIEAVLGVAIEVEVEFTITIRDAMTITGHPLHRPEGPAEQVGIEIEIDLLIITVILIVLTDVWKGIEAVTVITGVEGNIMRERAEIDQNRLRAVETELANQTEKEVTGEIEAGAGAPTTHAMKVIVSEVQTIILLNALFKGHRLILTRKRRISYLIVCLKR